jgi:CD109 antigen
LEFEFSRGISDNYTLAIISYALSTVGSPKAEEALNLLMQRSEKEGNAWDTAEACGMLGFIE